MSEFELRGHCVSKSINGTENVKSGALACSGKLKPDTEDLPQSKAPGPQRMWLCGKTSAHLRATTVTNGHMASDMMTFNQWPPDHALDMPAVAEYNDDIDWLEA